MLRQTLRPTSWVIVDDESSDGTLDLARKVALKHGWVKVIQRKKEPGTYDGSFRAFIFGVNSLQSDWDYLMKLDADTVLAANHIERLVSKFQSDQSLGVASGVCLGEPGVVSHPRGNNRMYRRECWKQISFPEDGWGWDTVDEVFARLNGWKTEAFSEIVCTHLRPKLPDSKYRFHQGRLSRHLGYYWWFIIGRSAKMVLSYGLMASIAFLVGYTRGGLGSVDDRVKQAIKADQRARVAKIAGLKPGKVLHPANYMPSFDEHDPLIAVGMPTLNRAKYITKTIDALHNLSYPPKRTRLIFVDGYSKDGTFEIIQSFARDHADEYEAILTRQEKTNISAARNICLESVGDAQFLLFLDSDVIATPEVLNRLIGLSEGVGISSIFYSSFSYQRPKPEVKLVETVGMGCTLIKREVWEKVGTFDVTLPVNEDTDYCLRARKLGFTIVQDTTRQLLHMDEGRYSPKQTVYQSFRYRRVYAKFFTLGVYRKRFILYALLDLTLLLGIFVQPLFFAVPLGYLIGQLVRRRNPRLAIFLAINSLIIFPLTIIGVIERRFS
jgi:glycosyltransferase involved in cell wall biosynthesis